MSVAGRAVPARDQVARLVFLARLVQVVIEGE